MEVVYLFHENGKVRIPFYDYDPKLFEKFRATKLGFWDHSTHQYIVKANSPGHTKLPELLHGRPYVEVDRSPEEPLVISNVFRMDALESSDGIEIEAKQTAVNHHSTVPIPLPELFTSDWEEKLTVELHSRKYSPRTIRSYIQYNKSFCKFIQKSPDHIGSTDVKSYAAYLDSSLFLSSSTMNLAISALKFFYHNVLQKNILEEQHRPKLDQRLPAILSKSEINVMLEGEKNSKHRLLIMLAYSSGLRVSEVVSLKKSHVDFTRKVIYIRSGKGRKDRNSILSDRAASFISEYVSVYGIENWLFPGIKPGSHLSIRSAQNIFNKAVLKVGIQKDVSIHSLRHAFATHLLENGVDIKYIQELLGHAFLKTTERYTHVARRSALKIKSPLDDFGPDDD
ncbi:phage integrase family protein [Treponema primitia ZAS-2]|uniref:Phage integrase family protein n=1 Tax=Treponema primitia (strain ATCC BAA-887 / DSM 12427 / ZAS-2) TaxID=545694 RepID=F5YIJ6_TREPZ|nr:tyrosine-type recombinase/integrase [Treponema primitia]AEF85374.1 phage integrase family protein [Treponema primitia ZAS-2]